jgi:hypothetical protein
LIAQSLIVRVFFRGCLRTGPSGFLRFLLEARHGLLIVPAPLLGLALVGYGVRWEIFVQSIFGFVAAWETEDYYCSYEVHARGAE